MRRALDAVNRKVRSSSASARRRSTSHAASSVRGKPATSSRPGTYSVIPLPTGFRGTNDIIQRRRRNAR